MTERICEAALAVWSPWHLVIANGIILRYRAGADCPCHECIRIVAEHLDPDGRHAEVLRMVPTVIGGLTHKERPSAR